jgi:twitching motility protein PilT
MIAPPANAFVTLLAAARARTGLSDLHVVAGEERVIAREGGRLRPFAMPDGLGPAAIVAELETRLTKDETMRLAARGDVTVRLMDPAFGLVRVHVYKTCAQIALAIRFLDSEPPRLEDLNLPPAIGEFAKVASGLVLLTGPVGSGKSSTLAGLVRRMDELTLNRHVRIIESPIEWVHKPKHIAVTHVGVGIRQDAQDVFEAFESAKRSDAQVIVFGELLDARTMVAAVEAAYGASVLVIATMHAPSVGSALLTLIDAFPPEREKRLRSLLADSFMGGASLRLLPRSDRIGRVPAAEIVLGTDAIKDQIRMGSIESLRGALKSGPAPAQTLAADVSRLLSEGRVDRADAALVVGEEHG